MRPPHPAIASVATAVYRFYDASGVLLYVGVARDPQVRWTAHAYSKSWWNEVADKRVDWYPDRLSALAAEAVAIATESPRYNVLGTDRRPLHNVSRERRSYADIRSLSVADAAWNGYAEVVGELGRSADLRRYMEWRVDNPTTPLPGQRRGPVKRTRPARDTS